MSNIPRGYKQTEVGVIPSDWGVKKLGDYVKITSGESPSNFRFKSNGVPYFKVEQLNNSSKYQKETPYYIETNNIVLKGSIIFPKRGASIFLNKIRILEEDSFMDTNLMTLSLSEELSNEYLFYILTHYELWRIADTTSIPQINNKHITPFLIPLPPTKAEQCAIATALSDADALISSLEQLIAKKRNIKQGTMQLLLTGKKRLPGFSGKWEVKKLGEILSYEQPTKYLVKSTEYYDNNDIAVLTANKSFILGYTDENDGVFENVPVVIFDDFTTASKYVDFPFKVKSSALKILKLKNESSDLRFVFGKMQLIQFPLGDHKRYWISEYQHLKIEVPSISEQTAIAKTLSDMDAEIEQLEQKLDKYRMIKQGMMQELLTGKKRLI